MFWMQITKFYYVRHFTIGYYVIRYIYASRQVRIIYQVRIFLLLPVTRRTWVWDKRKYRTVLRQISIRHLSASHYVLFLSILDLNIYLENSTF